MQHLNFFLSLSLSLCCCVFRSDFFPIRYIFSDPLVLVHTQRLLDSMRGHQIFNFFGLIFYYPPQRKSLKWLITLENWVPLRESIRFWVLTSFKESPKLQPFDCFSLFYLKRRLRSTQKLIEIHNTLH